MIDKFTPFTAKLTNGEDYEGIQEYRGMGSSRWCALCGTHKPLLGGFLKHVMGGRHWVCAKHPKPSK